MSKPLTRSKSKVIFVFYLLTAFVLGNYVTHAQTQPGILLSWDNAVGCQTYEYEKERKLYIENIEDSECVRVCQYSYVKYTLSNLPPGATTTWSAVGGVVSGPTNTYCYVSWGGVGAGSISFTITSGNTVITKTLCIEKIMTPTAKFEVAPQGQSPNPQEVYICSNQAINFDNLSSTNNGSNLVSYYWEFGDGSTSAAFEPSHTYLNDGEYDVILTVTNACNCIDKYKIRVIAKAEGFEISCPTVICEGQSDIYSLPFDGMDLCQGNFNWEVIGGQVLSQGGGNIEVLWNNVDQEGFGYVTFNPSQCQLACIEPTTIKIPVIQSNGTIQGPSSICLGKQGRYKLPQWPTTDFQWEIIGNSGNTLAEVVLTDQRNEVVVTPFVSGTLVLRATYTNTLLHCSGEAEFIINVAEPLEIFGEETICQNTNTTYTNSVGANAIWTLKNNNGNTIYTINAVDFNYTFNQVGNFVLTVSANGYCEGEEKTIKVIGIPSTPSGIDGDLQVCPNVPYSYAVQSPDATADYYWEVTNGNIVGSDSGPQVNITFNGTFPATVKVYKKTVSPIECISAPRTITVNQIPINVVISSDNTALCGNTIASYQALQTGTPNLYTDGDAYTWSISNPTLGSVSNGQGTNSIDVTWNNVTTITTVDLILTVNKCNISPAPQFVKQITLYPKTEIQIVASNNPVCAGGLYPVTFTIQSANGVPLSPSDQVTWNLGSGDFTTPPGQFTYTTPLSNNSTVNIGQVITAYIANANNCGQTNTDSVTVTVLPNPPAIATLTSAANAFCSVAEINATITVSSNISGVTFVWYKNNVALSPPQTGTSLNVTPAMGPGAYTFQATNPNGCVSVSNPVYISVVSCSPIDCTIAETLQNNSTLTGCGQITFSGTASGSPLSQVWQVLGPSPSDYSVSGNVLTGKPGNYKIVYKVFYPCQEGGTGYIVNIKDVVIPYEPDFSYVVECNNNNSFNVNFIDNSNFYAPVISQPVRFYYKTTAAATFTGPIAYDPSLGVFEIQNLAAGNYIFKIEVEGTHPNTPTYVCEKTYSVNLQGIDPFLSIIVNQSLPINCHDTPVKFELSNFVIGSTVLWDFGDGAQNTMSSPDRVFTVADSTYTVTCTITNQYGCSRLLTTQVYIPKKCFFGDIVSDPDPASVCQGESVTLTYVPNGDNCSVADYVWMNGNLPVPNAPNTDQLSVTSTGFYWVKVISANNCSYNTPTQIRPIFNTLPTVKIIGDATFCEDQDVILKAVTNAPTLNWYVNGVLQSQFNNLNEVQLFLSTGNYTITAEAISTEGCINVATHTLSIQEPIQSIAFDVSIDCNPYEATITAYPSNGSNFTYNWSNGESTQTIVVNEGGPYKVTVSMGGCSTSAEIDIPKNPENYIWIFPTGCYSDCKSDGNPNVLIGPNLPLDYWSWNQDGYSDENGANSYADPYTLVKDASYTLTINTGACELTSEPLEYATSRCEECKIERVDIKDIKQNDTPYCSFTYSIVIYSGSTFPYQATLSDDAGNVLIIPSSFTIYPGVNIIDLTIIPQGSFTAGGYTNWTLHGFASLEGGNLDCLFKIADVRVPKCASNTVSKLIEDTTKDNNTITLYPNPAKEEVNIRYNLALVDASIEIFDLSGRNIYKKLVISSTGDLQLNTSTYQAGVYIVVVKQNNEILLQQKLIIE
jgi:hypothetical protein